LAATATVMLSYHPYLNPQIFLLLFFLFLPSSHWVAVGWGECECLCGFLAVSRGQPTTDMYLYLSIPEVYATFHLRIKDYSDKKMFHNISN